MQAAESPEAWTAMLEGLAALCQGLAGACAAGELEPDVATGLFAGGQLARLLALCATPEARSAALGIAAALPDCAGLRARSGTLPSYTSACLRFCAASMHPPGAPAKPATHHYQVPCVPPSGNL